MNKPLSAILSITFSLSALFALLGILATLPIHAAQPATPLAACQVVTPADSGAGSFRSCIAQLTPGDTITFDPSVFPLASPVSITLLSELPVIVTDSVTIDASNAGVILDGIALDYGYGLHIRSDSNVVRGLQILRFPWTGIQIDGGASNNLIGGSNATPGGFCSGACNLISGNQNQGISIWDPGTMGNVISGNYIGTDISGTTALPNRDYWGVGIGGDAQDNLIGGDSAAERNLISGNVGYGIRIEGSGTTSNTVTGNYIGTDVTGGSKIPNGLSGVYLLGGASENLIGGDNASPGGLCTGECNLISGNNGFGVALTEPDTLSNTISGNYVGTDVSGTMDLGNGLSGIQITGRSAHNLVGGNTPAQRNLVSGNGACGVDVVSEAHDNVIQGNYMGTDVGGTQAIGNFWAGVAIDSGARDNLIVDNLASGNGSEGILLRWCYGNTVIGNLLGTDVTGTAAVPNSQSGVSITEAPGTDGDAGAKYNRLGGTTAAERNIISGNSRQGIWISGSGTVSNTISGNYIGTDISGTAALPNQLSGLNFDVGASYNTVGGVNASPGGACSGACNLISGNGSNGVAIHGSGTVSNTVTGNYIGVDINGLAVLGNAHNGIWIGEGAQWNLVGGTTPAERNIITYNTQDGVSIADIGTEGNVVQGNWIGVDANGTRDVRVTQVAYSPDYPADNTIWVGTDGQGIFRTTDGGLHWLEMNSGLTDLHVNNLAVSPAFSADQTLFAQSAEAAFKSADGGSNWVVITPPGAGGRVLSIAVSPDYATDQTLLLGTYPTWSAGEYSGGVYKSVDGGVTWIDLGFTEIAAGALDLTELGLPPTDDAVDEDLVRILSYAHEFEATGSEGRGSLLEPERLLATLGDTYRPGLAVAFSPDFGNDQTLLVGTWGSAGSLYKSTDAGATWTAMNNGLSSVNVDHIVMSPGYATDQTLFVMDKDKESGDPYRSVDGAANWQMLAGGLPDDASQVRAFVLSPDFTTDGTILASYAYFWDGVRGVFRSTDWGDTWTQPSTEVQNQHQISVMAITADGTGGYELLLAAGQMGLLGSTDLGATWAYANGDLTDPGNTNHGVSITNGASSNTIGGPSATQGNLISKNGGSGITVVNPGTSYNAIQYNYIGTDVAGIAGLGNGVAGIGIYDGSTHNEIDGNLISANVGSGLSLSGTANNTMSNNRIGTDLSGMIALPNLGGVEIGGSSTDNLVTGNLISGNNMNGAGVFDAGTARNVFTANIVGLAADGTTLLGNDALGLGISTAEDIVFGGIGPGEGNTIAGQMFGIHVINGTNTLILGNEIHDTNTAVELTMSSTGSQVVGNQIHDNSDSGIVLYDGVSSSQVSGNHLYANGSGVSIYWGATTSRFEENSIHHNDSAGIFIGGGTAIQHTLSRNEIYGNGSLGISLSDGGNTELPAPVIITFDLAAGTASGTACAGCTVELFSDEYAEGRWFEGSVVADGAGNWTITTGGAFAGPELTATATDGAGNTSEFGQDWPADPPPAPTISAPLCGVTNLSQPTFRGFAQMGSTVRLGTGGLALGTTTADDQNRWTRTASTALPDASYVITATATTIWGTSPEALLNLAVDSTLCYDPVGVTLTQQGVVQHPRDGQGCVDPSEILSIDLWPDLPVTVSVPVKVPTATVYIEVNSVPHSLSDPDGDGTFTGSFLPPDSGSLVILLVVDCGSGSQTMQVGSTIDPDGYVYDADLTAGTGITQTVEGVTVTLEVLDPVRERWLTWDAPLYGQVNPQMTGPDGYFAFYTPPGQYRLVADGVYLGYGLYRSPVLTVVDKPIRFNVALQVPRGRVYLPLVVRDWP